MIKISFPDAAAKHRAIGYLAGRFSFKTFASGEMLVPLEALAALAMESIPFKAEGPATYAHCAPQVRTPAPAAV